jgi:hypothetical protein
MTVVILAYYLDPACFDKGVFAGKGENQPAVVDLLPESLTLI